MAQPPNALAFSTLLFVQFCGKVHVDIESGTIPSYTPHGRSHIQGVEVAIDNLTAILEEKTRLTPLEKLLLRFCAWSHDLGMVNEVANTYQQDMHGKPPGVARLDELRKDHDKASAYYLQKHVPSLFEGTHDGILGGIVGVAPQTYRTELLKRLKSEGGLPEDVAVSMIEFFTDGETRQRWLASAATLANTVNLIARYHRRAEDITRAPEFRYFLGERIRVQLLAAIFRLGDALHVDRTRFEQTGFEILARSPQFSDESRVHWIKSFIVSSIRIDPESATVHVQADVPVASELGGDDFAVDSERMHGMVSFIVNDLTEDVMSVARILLAAGFPPLLGVTADVQEIPAMHYPDDVRAALNHIYASSSPNTSRLITIALDVLQWHLAKAEKREDGADYLLRKLNEQLISLGEQLEQRPCHEALRKIQDLLVSVKEAWADKEFQHGSLAEICGTRYVLHTLLEGVRATVIDKRAEVKKGVENPEFIEIFDACSDIVLYGYSEQVLALLAQLNATKRDQYPDIHVLECRTKTAYAPAGDLLYLDGERYAHALRKQGYKGKVTIEPDAAVGRILTEKRKPLIVLGSNAVYPGGTFVHSMGHLTVAAAAKAAHLRDKCAVVVLTDTMKIGEQQHPKPRERHEDEWLTPRKHVIAALKKAGVELHNWQEDTVPSALVDKLLVLDKGLILVSPYAELEKLRFEAAEVYSKSLERRFLAAFLAFKHNTLVRDIKDEIAKRGKKDHGVIDWNAGNWDVAGAYTAEADASLTAKVREEIEKVWGSRVGTVATARSMLEQQYRLRVRREPGEAPATPAAAGDAGQARADA